DGGGCVGAYVPPQPGDQSVDGGAAAGFGQGELIVLALEGVAAVADAVGPGGQHRTMGGGRKLLRAERDDHIATVHLEEPQVCADFGHHGPSAAVADLELLTGHGFHACSLSGGGCASAEADPGCSYGVHVAHRFPIPSSLSLEGSVSSSETDLNQ